jgi:hypothetical protein
MASAVVSLSPLVEVLVLSIVRALVIHFHAVPTSRISVPRLEHDVIY